MRLHEAGISSQESENNTFKADRGEPIADASSFEALLSALNANNPGEIQQLIHDGLLTQEELDTAIDQIINNVEISLNKQDTQHSLGQEAVKAGGDYVPIDNIVFPYAAKEEVWNDEWDEPSALGVADVLHDKRADSEFRPIEMIEYEQEIRAALESLPERKLNRIRLRVGFNEDEPMTFKEISSLKNITEVAVRVSVRRGLKKLRRIVGDDQLREYDELLVANDNLNEAVIAMEGIAGEKAKPEIRVNGRLTFLQQEEAQGETANTEDS